MCVDESGTNVQVVAQGTVEYVTICGVCVGIYSRGKQLRPGALASLSSIRELPMIVGKKVNLAHL